MVANQYYFGVKQQYYKSMAILQAYKTILKRKITKQLSQELNRAMFLVNAIVRCKFRELRHISTQQFQSK